ncbi:MAG: hypothetical protein LBL61_05670 [Elusimicrobiota bacterium]|jgi:hypothetical protein|nr:hypothetical protein [Elusimicrobiota bacterium]
MPLNEEETIKKLLEQTAHGADSLRVMGEGFTRFYNRLELIAKQHRRRMPVRDDGFQDDMRSAVGQLRALADDAQDSWQAARACYYAADRAAFVREHRVLIKQLKAAAAALRRRADEIYDAYKNLSALGADLPLRPNWWVFESSANDLLKTAASIFALTRDMERYYE